MRLLFSMVGVAFVAVSASASAFVDPITITPANPRADQPVSMSFRAGGCHALTSPDAAVTVADSTIDVVIEGSLIESQPFCINDPFNYTYALGTVPAGQYTLNLRIRGIADPFPVSAPVQTTALVVLPAGTPSSPIPAIDLAGSMLAFLLLASLGIRWFVRR